MNTRAEREREVVTSFSRYVGYTTGASGLFERLEGILNEFAGKPAVYRVTLIEAIKKLPVKRGKKREIKDNYATGALDFVNALGLVSNVTGDKSPANPKLVKYKISEAGRAFRSANRLELPDFERFIMEVLLAETDADLYCLLMEYFHLEKEGIATQEDLKSYVKGRLLEIRAHRCDWINSNVKHKFLRDKIANQGDWLKIHGNKIELKGGGEISDAFLKHHVGPRTGWAEHAGHLEKVAESQYKITPRGEDFFRRLSKNHRYSWIGPSREDWEKMLFKETPDGGIPGPPRELLRATPDAEPADENAGHIEKIKRFMNDAFEDLCLATANQASIEPVRLFVNFLEHEENVKIDPAETIEKIIKENSNTFAAISSSSSRLGYYQRRRTS